MRNIFLAILLCVSNSVPAQETIFCQAVQHGFDARDPEEPRGCLADNYYYWMPGQTLYIKFLNGSKQVHQQIENISRAWEKNANIKFLFVDSGLAQIRINLHDNGYISATTGVVANVVPQDEANVEIDTSYFTSVSKMQAIVLHVFGHILGLQHEVKIPDNGIKWNREELDKYFSAFEWDADKIDHRVIDPYSVSYSNGMIPDQLSVMYMPLPSKWTNECPGEWNALLSTGDKQLAEKIYPFKTSEAKSLVPALVVTGFKSIRISQSTTGLLFYPEFEIILRNIQSIIMYVMVFDENYDLIYSTNKDPMIIAKPFYNLKDKKYGINKGTNDIGFFLPSEQMPAEYKGRKLKAVLRIYQYDYFTGKKLTYSSTPCDFIWSQ